MFIINSSGGDFRAIIQADYTDATTCEAFGLSRTMLRLERLDEEKTSVFTFAYTYNGGYSGLTSYYSDTDGVLEIPLRNVVNAHLFDTLHIGIALREVGSSTDVDAINFDMVTHDGISYSEALSPKNKDINITDFPDALRQSVVLPPNVILNPNFTGTTFGILVESNYQDYDGTAEWSGLANGLGTPIVPAGDRDNRLNLIAAYDTLQLAIGKNHDKIKQWKLEKPDPCTDLVAVQWTSMTGCLRRHYFPVVSYINGDDKEVSIINAGNGYDVRKNPIKGVRCRLTGLTPYGCWYYQDMIQASDAHAIVAPSTANFGDEIASTATLCYVEGGMEATPEGHGFFSFEFTIKLRHYETV